MVAERNQVGDRRHALLHAGKLLPIIARFGRALDRVAAQGNHDSLSHTKPLSTLLLPASLWVRRYYSTSIYKMPAL